ncbi:hypothetical protein G9Q38_02785 [Pusillimonas sp. DMV24BSW_D]|uniref:hypothetical protein n=1 Tax=Neopusillimonas aestuarii TaxID=2716226 RepID=UPI0014088506|nr:hypothetical protein [Pusillimonas sp. DMV24BSW_D]QIM48176.1 hypothetical protein G9Q38_02785 [Pusillimonas sp. DMV24BSW_D]
MKTESTHQPTPRDFSALRNTLLKLTATHKIICTVVVVVVALVWYYLLQRVVAFGHTVDYTGLEVLGGPTIEFLNRYNPYFWWALVALCTLIIAYFLINFVRAGRKRVNAQVVATNTMQSLVAQLSEPAKDVLRWVWDNPREPITVGDLQQTSQELRNGRAQKIAISREHLQLLGSSPVDPP